jgi:hypothetical protein
MQVCIASFIFNANVDPAFSENLDPDLNPENPFFKDLFYCSHNVQ